MPDAKLLNVGCGPVFHRDWVNLDVSPASREVMEWDARRGLPFADRTFDACYSSHVLEHLTTAEAERFVRELYRVLKARGIARLVVPDLEHIARDYLRALERAATDHDGSVDDYDWMVIQLLDQMVRKRSGGAMIDFWRDPTRGNAEFVVARAGIEAEQVMAESRADRGPAKRTFVQRLRAHTPAQVLREARRRTARILVHAIAGRTAADAFAEGLFRNAGEIHQWMYDRYSLTRLLLRAGFAHAAPCAAEHSGIPDFARYELDVARGRVRKPDSLFVEAVKGALDS